MDETKCCPRCEEMKPISDFKLLQRGSRDYYCRSCRKEYNLIQYGNRRRGYALEDAFKF